MTEGTEICKRYKRADEREAELLAVEKQPNKTLPRHSSDDGKAPGTQFMHCKVGRTVIKKHSYITPVTCATYPWNYAHPSGKKSAFRMPKTVYPRREYHYK